MRNVAEENCRQNQNTHFTFNIYIYIYIFEIRVVYEIMCKNIVQPDKPQMTIRRMRVACLITKATDTHSEYVILYTAAMVTRTLFSVTL